MTTQISTTNYLHSIDETLGLHSVMAARTTSTLRPEPSRYFPTEANRVEDSAVSRRPPRRVPEEIKQRIHVSSRRLQQLETSRKSRADELAELRQEVRTDQGAQGRAALDDALTNCRGWDADDKSTPPRLERLAAAQRCDASHQAC